MRRERNVWSRPVRSGLKPGTASRWGWGLLIVGLAACVPDHAALREIRGQPTRPARLEHQDDREVLVLCGGGLCTVVPEGPGSHSERTLTQGIVAVESPPAEVEAPERLGESGQEDLPRDRAPLIIFEINPVPPEEKLPPNVRALLAEEARKPHVKHHIFSREFQLFFKIKGINIHDWVLPLLLEDHLRIHWGARGGPWNADWRAWIEAFGKNATKEDIYRHAGEMIYRFCLTGRLTRYYCSYSFPIPAPTNPIPPVDDND